METKGRVIYADILRIISIFAVLIIHSLSHLYSGDRKLNFVSCTSGLVLIGLDCFVRFAVPVFIMISGIFMLSPEKDRGIKKLYSKNLLRIVTAFVFWSLIYAFFNSFSFSTKTVNYTYFAKFFINVEYHLGFLYIIAGLYIITPILRMLVQDKKITEYFLIIWFIFCVLAKFTEVIPNVGSQVYDYIKQFNLSSAIQYSGYYVLGYYLNKYTLTKKSKNIIYFLAVLSCIFTVVTTIYFSIKTSSFYESYLNYFLPTTMFSSCAIFIFVKSCCENHTFSEKKKKVITSLSKYSFGVYLCHVLVIKTIMRLDILNFRLSYIVLFLINLIAATIISNLISAVLNRIPFLNKYIV